MCPFQLLRHDAMSVLDREKAQLYQDEEGRHVHLLLHSFRSRGHYEAVAMAHQLVAEEVLHQRGLSRRRLVHPVDQQNQLSHPERLQQDLATTSDGSFEKVCRMKYSTRWIDSVVRYRRNNRAICLKCGRGGSRRRLGVLDAEVNGPIFRREKSTRYCVLQLRVLSLQLRSILLCICLVRFHAPEVRNTVIDFIQIERLGHPLEDRSTSWRVAPLYFTTHEPCHVPPSLPLRCWPSA